MSNLNQPPSGVQPVMSPPFVGVYRPEDGQLYCQDLPTTPDASIGTVLVTGGTGYIGGRLVPELMARGYRVRVMVRAFSPEYAKKWPKAEIVVADASDTASLSLALKGGHTAYYLIHSLLLGPKEFEAMDLANAGNFRRAAHEVENPDAQIAGEAFVDDLQGGHASADDALLGGEVVRTDCACVLGGRRFLGLAGDPAQQRVNLFLGKEFVQDEAKSVGREQQSREAFKGPR